MSARARLWLTVSGAIVVAVLLFRALAGRGHDFATALHTAPVPGGLGFPEIHRLVWLPNPAAA